MIYSQTYQSPMGPILITIDTRLNSLIELKFVKTSLPNSKQPPLIKKITKQLDEYFSKKRTIFDIPIHYNGTPFQNKVWEELLKIPYGNTLSYGDIAKKLGKPPLTSRAIGTANSKNKIAIIIPCHRVIRSNGKLSGYAGGVDKKIWLLNHENN
ncbi:methylated-DNA--[protein]-cysteine S-methyltransferase [archaeon]|nr:methylated-DNA--[protein]-cysteine S-methyltransferase [archaeon]NDB54287.1 methylated-DNA--[protein]-cysteine S-methyltransferase [archaeon]NDB78268.1 methylated-DNA--[protein]-cysteine S-methyltransferase [archaeon]NDF27898.1 methylated-DNA--[protein]-cysteine S-methyltransferase [archaeon]